jgi:hypothetical protein
MADTVYILTGREVLEGNFSWISPKRRFPFLLGSYSTRELAERAATEHNKTLDGRLSEIKYTITEVTLDGEARRQ